MPIQDCPGKNPSPHEPMKREASNLDVRSPEEDVYTFVDGIKEDKPTLAHGSKPIPASLQGMTAALTGGLFKPGPKLSTGSGMFDGLPKRDAVADEEDTFVGGLKVDKPIIVKPKTKGTGLMTGSGMFDGFPKRDAREDEDDTFVGGLRVDKPKAVQPKAKGTGLMTGSGMFDGFPKRDAEPEAAPKMPHEVLSEPCPDIPT